MVKPHIVPLSKKSNALIVARHSGSSVPHMLVIAMPKEIQAEQRYQHERMYRILILSISLHLSGDASHCVYLTNLVSWLMRTEPCEDSQVMVFPKKVIFSGTWTYFGSLKMFQHPLLSLTE